MVRLEQSVRRARKALQDRTASPARRVTQANAAIQGRQERMAVMAPTAGMDPTV
jgi:hypothetical protein